MKKEPEPSAASFSFTAYCRIALALIVGAGISAVPFRSPDLFTTIFCVAGTLMLSVATLISLSPLLSRNPPPLRLACSFAEHTILYLGYQFLLISVFVVMVASFVSRGWAYHTGCYLLAVAFYVPLFIPALRYFAAAVEQMKIYLNIRESYVLERVVVSLLIGLTLCTVNLGICIRAVDMAENLASYLSS